MVAASGGFVAIIGAIAMSVWRARETKNIVTYGSARWATKPQIRAAGLLSPNGVVLGQFGRDYLRHDGPEHVLCFAPTRSGKGVGLVIPTLLTWPGSVIVHDIKGENWTLTAGWRSRFGRALLFDPTNPKSSAYNPLLEVRRGDAEVRDVQNVADILVDPEGALERRNHWEKTSHSAGRCDSACSLCGARKDTGRRRKLPFRPEAPHRDNFARHDDDASFGRQAASRRRLGCARTSEQERERTVRRAVDNYVVSRSLPRSGGRESDEPVRLVHRRSRRGRPAGDPISRRAPSDISRTKPLVRLILNQIGRRLTEELNAKSRRHRVLLMLDEFPALGRLDFFEAALAFMAGYGLKGFLITQSLNQIEKAYGANNAILDNCHVRVAFATNDERTAKRVSDALGTATEMRAMKNYAGHRLSPWLGHLMVSRQETARPLLTPGEVMQLPPADELVLITLSHTAEFSLALGFGGLRRIRRRNYAAIGLRRNERCRICVSHRIQEVVCSLAPGIAVHEQRVATAAIPPS